MKPELHLLGDHLHRLVKLALDTGEAATLEDAEALFTGYRLAVAVGADAARNATHQAALLTIVNAGNRSVLGGVFVTGDLDVPLATPLPGASTLAEAVTLLGGRFAAPTPGAAMLVLGDAAPPDHGGLALRVTFDGWSGGVIPVRDGHRLAERAGYAPAGVLAGCLAVSEAFQHLRHSNPAAGRRRVGVSLWRPEMSWLDEGARGPEISALPSNVWLIGLGNLGQAYLWTLGFLPYAEPGRLQLVLQDFDVLAPSNESTSLLTSPALVGQKKTRAMAAWAERRGFVTTIVERRFRPDFRVAEDEPPVALCGMDNALGRAALEEVGFGRVIEAGLGKGVSDFLALRLHTFPGPVRARELWGGVVAETADLADRPAYRALRKQGLDECGVTLLAGRTVGAPFVGGVAAALAVSELVRLASGARGYELIDAHLKAPEHRTVLAQPKPSGFNPGITEPQHVS